MKSISSQIASVLIIICTIFLAGCPVSTKYPLGEEGAEKINKDLIGEWTNDSTKLEAKKIKIEKESETAYKITVIEKGEMFMAETTDFKGWLTKLEDKTFLVLQEKADTGLKQTYYVYNIQTDKKTVITHDITLKVGGTDAVTSVKAYQEEVKASMKKEGFLAGKIVWKKE